MIAVGANGAPAGMTGDEAGESIDVVTKVVDVTVKVYGVPLAKPLITQLLAPVVLQVNPPGLAVAV